MKRLIILLMVLGISPLARSAIIISVDGNTDIDEIAISASSTVIIGIYNTGSGEDPINFDAYLDFYPNNHGAYALANARLGPVAGDFPASFIFDSYGAPDFIDEYTFHQNWLPPSSEIAPGDMFLVDLHCESPAWDVFVELWDERAGLGAPVDTLIIHQATIVFPPQFIDYPDGDDENGRYIVSWGESPGADYNEVERSTDGGSTWPTVVYSGGANSFLTDEPNNTSNRYRVRGCVNVPYARSGWCTGTHDCNVTYCYEGADYSQWTAVGRPGCWCWPRQCYGDADGQQEGKSPNQVWVGGNDLTILSAAWQKTAVELYLVPEPNACADFDRSPQGKSPNIIQVGGNDLTVLTNSWTTNPPWYGNPPADCLPGNRAP